jgi:hypothetical protein
MIKEWSVIRWHSFLLKAKKQEEIKKFFTVHKAPRYTLAIWRGL